MDNKYYYSSAQDAFYIENISPDIPDDAIEITKEEHSALLKSINEDQKCITVKKGTLTLSDRVRTADEINASIKSQLDGIDTMSLRAVRSVLAAMHSGETPDAEDIATLAAYEREANDLRKKLK